jgi:hypothetical protein
LWAFISIREDQIKFDLVPYSKREDANPSSDDASLLAFMNGFLTGQFALREIINVFDEFPDLPHAITFFNGSWYYWEQACADHVAGRKSIQACFDRELSSERLQVMLAFRGLRTTGQYFVMKFDDDQAVAVIVDPKSPGHYVLQYLAGDIGLFIFRTLVSQLGIHEMPAPHTTVPHIPLLKLMALPAIAAPGMSEG